MIQQHGQIRVVQCGSQTGELSAQLHPNCIVCSPTNPRGLGQVFALRSDDSITADFELDETCEGYIHGLAGVTAELNVRFRHPIRLGEPATAIAQLKRASHPLYVLEARVVQDGQVKAQATGKFLHKPELVERTKGNGDGRDSNYRPC